MSTLPERAGWNERLTRSMIGSFPTRPDNRSIRVTANAMPGILSIASAAARSTSAISSPAVLIRLESRYRLGFQNPITRSSCTLNCFFSCWLTCSTKRSGLSRPAGIPRDCLYSGTASVPWSDERTTSVFLNPIRRSVNVKRSASVRSSCSRLSSASRLFGPKAWPM